MNNALAMMTVRAELSRDKVPLSLPVVPPERIPDFQRQWHRRPGLRALIRAAGRLSEDEVAHSKLVRALWELSRSDAWRADGRGLLCEYPEFSVLFRSNAA